MKRPILAIFAQDVQFQCRLFFLVQALIFGVPVVLLVHNEVSFSARFRVVRLGGPKIRKDRCNVADAHDAGDVFMYRDSSIAPMLEMRRRFKAVMDVLDSMFRNGASLSRSVELTVQWDRILAAGPVYLVTLEDFRAVQGQGLGHFLRIVSDVHHRLSDFIHGVVVHRRDEAFRGWRIGCGRIPLFTRKKWH